MEKGDKITIFCKPLTEEESEGEAKLIQKRYDCGIYNGKKLEMWTVKFLSDGFKTDRKILVR